LKPTTTTISSQQQSHASARTDAHSFVASNPTARSTPSKARFCPPTPPFSRSTLTKRSNRKTPSLARRTFVAAPRRSPFLRRAHALGVALCVITAADVSAAGVRGIAGELDQLGIADLFDVEPIAVDPLLLAATPDDSVATLRSKLAALLVLVPPTRFANDLLRIACNSVSINDTSIEFRLVRNQQRGALLRITHPTIVHCWQQYHSKSNINTNIDDDTIMYFNDFNIDRDLIPMLHSLNIKDNHFNRLIQDTALIHDIDGVKIARFGRVFCSKYNKPEALQLFLKQDQLNPQRIVFVDDNLTNSFNMFMYAAENNSIPTVTTSFWFKPPIDGKEESVRDEQSIALAHAFIDHFRDSPTTS
jgi:hypothetical protein